MNHVSGQPTYTHEQEVFRTLAEAIPQIVWTAREDGFIEYFNRRWYDYTGLNEADSLGWGWREALHPDDVERSISRWDRTSGTGETFEIEYRFRRGKDGEYRWHLGRAVQISAGEAIRWFGTSTDIDDQKRAAEEITRANLQLAYARDQAMLANRVKTSFLANMSHELRTPLNAILGYSELMEDDARRDGHQHVISDVKRIREAGEHLLGVINGILDISRLESGHLELNLDRFNVHAMIEQVLGIISPLVSRGGNTLILRSGDDLGTMLSDEQKVRQILFNILANACKFTSKGKVILECERTRNDDTASIIFRIIDTGIGIAPEQHQWLFKDFSQVDPSYTRRYSGAGLGLAISRRFALLLGGIISVESEQGKGSTFTVRLPVETRGESVNATPPPDFQ